MALVTETGVVTERVLFPTLASPSPSIDQHQHQQKLHQRREDILPPVRHSVAPTTDERTSATVNARDRRLGPQWMPRTPHALLLNTQSVAADDCAAVWRFLCDWTQSQLAMEAPATIPRFGTVSLKTHALTIRTPHFGSARYVLLLWWTDRSRIASTDAGYLPGYDDRPGPDFLGHVRTPGHG